MLLESLNRVLKVFCMAVHLSNDSESPILLASGNVSVHLFGNTPDRCRYSPFKLSHVTNIAIFSSILYKWPQEKPGSAKPKTLAGHCVGHYLSIYNLWNMPLKRKETAHVAWEGSQAISWNKSAFNRTWHFSFWVLLSFLLFRYNPIWILHDVGLYWKPDDYVLGMGLKPLNLS